MSQAQTFYLTEWYASDGLPGSEPEQVATVADGAGNLYVAGVTLNAYEKYDLHLAKYDDEGDPLWTETFNLTDTNANVIVGQMILDNSGNPVITGTVYNGPTNRYDALTIKFNTSGVYQWHKLYNGSGNHDDGGADLYSDGNDNIYIVGGTTDDTELMDFLVVAYESDGTLQWGNSRNGQVDVDDEAFDVAIDTSGQIIVGGYVTEEGNKDYFVEILNSSGTSIWFERFNGVHNLDDRGQKLTVETSGRISLTGKTGSPDGDTYTTVRYTPKSILIPPDDEDPSSGLYFTENRGQLLDTEGEAVPDIKFYNDRQSPALFFQEEGFSMVTSILHMDTIPNDTLHRVDVRFRQSKGAERVYALEPRADFHNYYLGHIPEGREKVGLSDRLIHTDAFTGIDIQYYSNNAGRKYYFVVKPGANPDDIKLIFDGQSSLSVNGSGDLVIGTAAGDIVLPEPEAFLVNSSGVESSVAWTPEFEVDGDTLTIGTEGYDGGKWLVIRVKEVVTLAPGDDWVTYLGSDSPDEVNGIDLDEEENLYVTGSSLATDFPIVPGEMIIGTLGSQNAFLAKFDDLVALVYFTFIGGNLIDRSFDVLASSNIYIVGQSMSNNFPITLGSTPPIGAFITALHPGTGTMVASRVFQNISASAWTSVTSKGNKIIVGGFQNLLGSFPVQSDPSWDYYQSSSNGDREGILAQLDANLNIDWATFFGGFGNDEIIDVEVNANGHLFIVGNTTTPFYSSTSCNPPGEGHFPKCHPSGASNYVFGNNTFSPEEDDIFIAEFNDDGELVWSTFFGGNKLERLGLFNSSSLAIFGNKIAILGKTEEFSTLPANTGGGYQQSFTERGLFIAEFENRSLVWKTGVGCIIGEVNVNNFSQAITYDELGNLYIVGNTNCSTPVEEGDYCQPPPNSNEFPACPPLSGVFFQKDDFGNPIYRGGARDLFLAAFSSNHTLAYATYFGGDSEESVRSIGYSNPSKRIFFGGTTNSTHLFPVEFPEEAYMQQDFAGGELDGFIARLELSGVITNISETVNSNNTLRLYPNPATDNLTIELPEGGQEILNEVFLYSIDGKMLKKITGWNVDRRIEIEVAQLPSGVYQLMGYDFYARFIKI